MKTNFSQLNMQMSRDFVFATCLCLHEGYVLLSCNDRYDNLMASYHLPKSTRVVSSVSDAEHMMNHQTVFGIINWILRACCLENTHYQTYTVGEHKLELRTENITKLLANKPKTQYWISICSHKHKYLLRHSKEHYT